MLTVNSKPFEIEADPRRLLLAVLREDLGLMGTKCGCGEGECGACTVILNGNTVNSCLTIVGQAHGGYVTTIEGLAEDQDGQKLLAAFAEKGAVQCGFCTPGLAISTSTLVDRQAEISEESIREGLSGHLCRCTGYVKIMDAVRAAAGSRLDLSRQRRKGFLPITTTDSPHFRRPDNLPQALETLAETEQQWRILAGGTDLCVRNENRLHTLNLLDIRGIDELVGISEGASGVSIGACTSFTDLINSPVIRERFPSLVAAARQIGGIQIQNSGTVGGNLANGSPAADLVPPLMSLGASLELVSKQGTETVTLDVFFRGLNRTVLRPGQLIRRIMIPSDTGAGKTIAFFDKLGTRKALSISKVSLALSGKMVKSRFAAVRIAMGSVAENVILAPKTAEILLAGDLTRERLNLAGEMISSEARPINDLFSTAAYCRQAVRGLLIRNLWRYTV